MRYDTQKIREEAVRLLGWKRGEPLNGLDVWISPTGVPSFWQDGNDAGVNGWPDPTSSIDDAFGLVEQFGMIVSHVPDDEFRWVASVIDGSDKTVTQQRETACIAICLCALEYVGRDPREFEL